MAAILQSLIFALRTGFVSFNFYQLVSYTEQILLIKNAIPISLIAQRFSQKIATAIS